LGIEKNKGGEMSELKPCPFCGSEAKLFRDAGNEVWPQSWNVACTKCWCSGKKFIGSSTWAVVKKEDQAAEANAVREWNTRAALPDDLRADVLALCDLAENHEQLHPTTWAVKFIGMAKRIAKVSGGGAFPPSA
jgi:hypothetical protein